MKDHLKSPDSYNTASFRQSHEEVSCSNWDTLQTPRSKNRQMAPSGLSEKDADAILDKVVTFPDGSRYERLEPMTNFRKDEGIARILYCCRREPHLLAPNDKADEIFVMKIKFQYANSRCVCYEPSRSWMTHIEQGPVCRNQRTSGGSKSRDCRRVTCVKDLCSAKTGLSTAFGDMWVSPVPQSLPPRMSCGFLRPTYSPAS